MKDAVCLSWEVICAVIDEWGEADWPTAWSLSDSLEPVMKVQYIAVKVADYKRSKSWTLKFADVETLLYACSLVCDSIMLTECCSVHVLSGVKPLVLEIQIHTVVFWVVTLGSGYGRWVLKVQKGILPPSSDTLHSPSCNADNHSMTIHTIEGLICYTYELQEESA
jgi:hypothetical protein